MNTEPRKCTRDTKQHRQTAAVVADAGTLEPASGPRDVDVGAFGKHRIQMRGDHDVWLPCNTWPVAEHVSNPIEPNVCQASLLERGLHRLRARRLVKWRGRNLAQADLIANDLGLVTLHGVERGSIGGLPYQI